MLAMDPIRIAIVGSRGFRRPDLIKYFLDNLAPYHLVTGGAAGADTMAAQLATEQGQAVTILKPDWKGKGKAAGPIRNQKIVDSVRVAIAFWDGRSKGTYDFIKKAKAANRMLIVVTVSDFEITGASIHEQLILCGPSSQNSDARQAQPFKPSTSGREPCFDRGSPDGNRERDSEVSERLLRVFDGFCSSFYRRKTS